MSAVSEHVYSTGSIEMDVVGEGRVVFEGSVTATVARMDGGVVEVRGDADVTIGMVTNGVLSVSDGAQLRIDLIDGQGSDPVFISVEKSASLVVQMASGAEIYLNDQCAVHVKAMGEAPVSVRGGFR